MHLLLLFLLFLLVPGSAGSACGGVIESLDGLSEC
jgi:hypothetical protein